MSKKLALGLALACLAVVQTPAQGAAPVGATVVIPSVVYDGSGTCLSAPATLNVAGGVSNGFAYWVTDNETLSGPTSSPSAPSFMFDNEEAPGTASMTMCPGDDHAGTYTYSADVWFKGGGSGDQYAGRVTATFTVTLATTAIVKIARRHIWQVKVVGHPYLVPYPSVRLQKLVRGKWRTVARGMGNSGGKFGLKPRPPAKYRLFYSGDVDRGLSPAVSKTFRRT